MDKIILPYKFSIAISEGCYITPDGEFILTHGSHSNWAMNRFGNDMSFLRYKQELAEYAVAIRNYDRLRTIHVKEIQSSERYQNIRFFNWKLMEWPISYIQAQVYFNNSYVDILEDPIEKAKYYGLNKVYGEEIKQIIADVPILERKNYFK